MTTVLVTGATDGLGRVVARDLAARGFGVLVHGRSAERAAAVAEEVGAAGVHLADFSVLAEVRELASSLPRRRAGQQRRLDLAGAGRDG